MNKYKVAVQINLFKDVLVEAETESDAYSKVMTMHEQGEIVFTEADQSDGMSTSADPELIEGTEPFNWNNVGEAQYDILRLEIACQLARRYENRNITAGDVRTVLRAIIDAYSDHGDEADVNLMFTDPMWLSEVVSLNISDTDF